MTVMDAVAVLRAPVASPLARDRAWEVVEGRCAPQIRGLARSVAEQNLNTTADDCRQQLRCCLWIAVQKARTWDDGRIIGFLTKHLEWRASDLRKCTPPPLTCDALDTILVGGDNDEAGAARASEFTVSLQPRERDIVVLLVQGYSQNAIRLKLKITPQRCKRILDTIREKAERYLELGKHKTRGRTQ